MGKNSQKLTTDNGKGKRQNPVRLRLPALFTKGVSLKTYNVRNCREF
jgi:hypothetical protein